MKTLGKNTFIAHHQCSGLRSQDSEREYQVGRASAWRGEALAKTGARHNPAGTEAGPTAIRIPRPET